ncbi:MAG: response regulator transcription factor [Bacillota bacterium]
MRILVCEDEKDLNRLLVKKLTSEGYGVDSCFDGEDGLYYAENTEYDLLVLDVMMPKMDGFTLVKKLRAKKIDVPVLFLTAKDATADVVEGLDLGANDYVVKPFSFEILLARIRVLIRTKPQKNAHVIEVADLIVNTSGRTVERSGQAIDLTTREYAILEYMLHHVNIVLTKEQIEDHIWNYEYEGGSSLVKVYIRYLRKKIDDPFPTKLIHTIRGTGYVLKDGGAN